MNKRAAMLTILAVLPLSLLRAWAAEPAGIEARRGAQVTGWRHDGATGYYPGKGFPAMWSEEQNLLWKAQMPGMTIALPIVVGERVFTIAEPFSLIALDIGSGKIAWQGEVNPFELIEDPGLSLEQGAELLDRFCSLKAAYGPTYGGRMVKSDDDEAARRTAELFIKRTREAAALLPGYDAAAINISGTDKYAEPWQRLRNAFYGRYAFHPDCDTQLHLGMAAATPVSDGRCVCVAFGSGQVACYTLDGRRRWARLFPLPGNAGKFTTFLGSGGGVIRNRYGTGSGNYVSHFSSPVIASGKVILWQHYRCHALDLETGKTVWEHLAGEGSCACLTVLRIAPNDTEVVVTAGGTVVRVDDGRVLAVGLRIDRGGRGTGAALAEPSGWPKGAVDGAIISRMGAEQGWHSPTTDGKDVVFVQKNNRNGPGPHSAVRLSLDDAGSLVFKKLWETKGQFAQTNPTALYHAGLLYIPTGGSFVILDAATGKTLHEVDGRVATSLVGADGYLIVTNGGKSAKGQPGGERCEFTVLTLGENPKPAGSGSIVSGLRVPCGVRRYFPEYLEWWRETNAKYHHLSNPVVYGDKVFYRSMTHLYCFGRK
jgi:hypothetical protein